MLIKACPVNADPAQSRSRSSGRRPTDSSAPSSYAALLRRAEAASASGRGGEGDKAEGGPGKDGPAPLTKEQLQRRVDALFPTADTCFFNVMLPAYSSLEVMRAKLLEIVTMDAWGMDG
jgi:hypothetical protein